MSLFTIDPNATCLAAFAACDTERAAIDGLGRGTPTPTAVKPNPQNPTTFTFASTTSTGVKDVGSNQQLMQFVGGNGKGINMRFGADDAAGTTSLLIYNAGDKFWPVMSYQAGRDAALLGTLQIPSTNEGLVWQVLLDTKSKRLSLKFGDAEPYVTGSDYFDATWPTGPGTLMSFSAAQAVADVTLAGGQAVPLTVQTTTADLQGLMSWAILYTGTPVTFGQQIERLPVIGMPASVVSAWTPMTVVENAVAGIATMKANNRVTEEASPFIYRISALDSNGNPVGPSVTRQYARPPKPSIGTNLSGFTSFDKPTSRVYQNLLKQGSAQDATSYATLTIVQNPDKILPDGSPRNSLVQLNFHALNGTREYELTAAAGSDITGLFFNGDRTATNVTRVGPRRWRFTMAVNRPTENPRCCVQIAASDDTNRPTGLCLVLVGESTVPYFAPSYIERMKRVPGPLRSMDEWAANLPLGISGMVWTERARLNQISSQYGGRPLEELVMLSRLTNRPLKYCVPYLQFRQNGSDFTRRALGLMFNGVGSDLAYALGRHLMHLIELGNENWNELGLGGPASTANQMAQWVLDHGIESSYANGGNDKAAMIVRERLRAHGLLSDLIDEVVSDARARLYRVFGMKFGTGNSQYGGGDMYDIEHAGSEQQPGSGAMFEAVKGKIDLLAIGPYVPGDPNAGATIGSEQPASRSPADISAFYTMLTQRRAAEIDVWARWAMDKIGCLLMFYEVNVAVGAIAGLTDGEARAWKTSQACYDFYYNVFCPLLLTKVGYSCIYYDIGLSSTGPGTWQTYEGEFAGAANKPFEAITQFIADNDNDMAHNAADPEPIAA